MSLVDIKKFRNATSETFSKKKFWPKKIKKCHQWKFSIISYRNTLHVLESNSTFATLLSMSEYNAKNTVLVLIHTYMHLHTVIPRSKLVSKLYDKTTFLEGDYSVLISEIEKDHHSPFWEKIPLGIRCAGGQNHQKNEMSRMKKLCWCT